jgi:hypothetical protein
MIDLQEVQGYEIDIEVRMPLSTLLGSFLRTRRCWMPL